MAEGEIRFEITDFKVELDDKAIKRLTGGTDIRRALEIIGQAGEDSAKRHAPVDTGNLRRSITHEVGQLDESTPFVRIGTNVRYAIYQELGTRFHPAQPFMRPAAADVGRLF